MAAPNIPCVARRAKSCAPRVAGLVVAVEHDDLRGRGELEQGDQHQNLHAKWLTVDEVAQEDEVRPGDEARAVGLEAAHLAAPLEDDAEASDRRVQVADEDDHGVVGAHDLVADGVLGHLEKKMFSNKSMPFCWVCVVRRPQTYLVPDRAEDQHRSYHFCPLCLDEMLRAFPLTPRKFMDRELVGGTLTSRRFVPPNKRVPCAATFAIPP